MRWGLAPPPLPDLRLQRQRIFKAINLLGISLLSISPEVLRKIVVKCRNVDHFVGHFLNSQIEETLFRETDRRDLVEHRIGDWMAFCQYFIWLYQNNQFLLPIGYLSKSGVGNKIHWFNVFDLDLRTGYFPKILYWKFWKVFYRDRKWV